MTQTARKLVSEFETVLEQMPEEEQEERIASYLEDLCQRVKAKEGPKPDHEKKALYEPFQVMLNANLDLPPDYSKTYEEHLYGTQKQND